MISYIVEEIKGIPNFYTNKPAYIWSITLDGVCIVESKYPHFSRESALAAAREDGVQMARGYLLRDGQYVNADFLSMRQKAELVRPLYAPTPVPPCRVCGADLKPSRIGGGEATKWNCSEVKILGHKWGSDEDRAASEHYRNSEWKDYAGSDSFVVDLIDAFLRETND